jgi:nitrite reductase/ring-hydroxylating ferredoxin subunit
MEWFKIFASEEEARSRIKEDKPQLLIVEGKRICMVLHQGKFFVVQDACTHNGESLSKGQVNYLGEIICPWHNYRFQLSTGQACDYSCRDLVTYALKSDNSGFFIGL